MLWVWLVLGLGCGDPAREATPLVDEAVAPPALSLSAWASTLGEAGLYDVAPGEVIVELSPRGAGGTVRLLAARRAAARPVCRSAGVCLELARPFIEVGRVVTTARTASFAFDPAAFALGVGDTVVFQAVAIRADGTPWATSPALTEVIQAGIVGCMFPSSPDYDPSATLPGACLCPREVVASTAAELAAVAGCAVLGTVDLRNYVDAAADLPNLVYADQVGATGAPGPIALRAPSLVTGSVFETNIGFVDTPRLEVADFRSVVSASVYGEAAAALQDLRLDSLRYGGIVLRGAGLPELRLPSAVTLGDVVLHDLPSLARIEWPALLTLLGGLELRDVGLTQPLSFPSLTEAPWLFLEGAPRLPAVELPLLESIGYVEVRGAPALAAFEAPALRALAGGAMRGPSALTSLTFPSLTTLETLLLVDHPALASVSVPALGDSDWQATFRDNPALCVTAEPIFAAPPPGCTSAGIRNLCDP
jgi:hypothetical protein